MSLLASEALIDNVTLRRRVQGAIRKTAAGRSGDTGPAAQLTTAGYTAPETVAAPFMLRLATNGEAVKAACPACGDGVDITDETIEWIVGDAWAAVAKTLFGDAA